MRSTSPSWPCPWAEVSGTKVLSLTQEADILPLAIIRPKFESEISIQDRHPTRMHPVHFCGIYS